MLRNLDKSPEIWLLVDNAVGQHYLKGEIMKDATRSQYTKLCLDLIEFENNVRTTWANSDLIILSELIEIIKYYRQFTRFYDE